MKTPAFLLSIFLAAVACAEPASPLFGRAMLILFPSAVPGKDYVVQDDRAGGGPYIAVWNLDASQPDAAQLAAAYVTIGKIDALRVQLDNSFATLPKGVQIQLGPLFAATRAAYLRGDTATAREIVATAALSSALEPTRTAMLALIDAAFPPAQ